MDRTEKSTRCLGALGEVIGLRAVTHSHNLFARRGVCSRAGYWGVVFDRSIGRYRGRVYWERRAYGAGRYRSALIAALARDDLAHGKALQRRQTETNSVESGRQMNDAAIGGRHDGQKLEYHTS